MWVQEYESHVAAKSAVSDFHINNSWCVLMLLLLKIQPERDVNSLNV